MDDRVPQRASQTNPAVRVGSTPGRAYKTGQRVKCAGQDGLWHDAQIREEDDRGYFVYIAVQNQWRIVPKGEVHVWLMPWEPNRDHLRE